MTYPFEHIPAPGSSRDMVAQHDAQNEVTTVELDDPPFEVIIPVRGDVPEECIPRTLLLSSTNPVLMILPRDMRRSRAIIIPSSNAIYLTESQEMGQQIATYITGGNTAVTNIGAYIPSGVGVPLDHRDAMYAAISTTTSTSPVAVIVQRYAE